MKSPALVLALATTLKRVRPLTIGKTRIGPSSTTDAANCHLSPLKPCRRNAGTGWSAQHTALVRRWRTSLFQCWGSFPALLGPPGE